jgi:hypothetical protein
VLQNKDLDRQTKIENEKERILVIQNKDLDRQTKIKNEKERILVITKTWTDRQRQTDRQTNSLTPRPHQYFTNVYVIKLSSYM